MFGLLMCAVLASALVGAGETAPSGDYATLSSWLAGSFSSERQSKEDPSYFDIRLHMTPIWQARSDGQWLYVEQARSDSLDQPYRQRVYCLLDRGGEFESRVYELPGDEPLKFAGAWRDPAKLAGVTPEQLKLKDGCSIFLKRLPDGSFQGSTRGTGCVSTRQGAAYTTSEVTLSADRLASWDRGWDKDGKQVWGAVKAGYQFDRIKE